jgi:hypothetical protein
VSSSFSRLFREHRRRRLRAGAANYHTVERGGPRPAQLALHQRLPLNILISIGGVCSRARAPLCSDFAAFFWLTVAHSPICALGSEWAGKMLMANGEVWFEGEGCILGVAPFYFSSTPLPLEAPTEVGGRRPKVACRSHATTSCSDNSPTTARPASRTGATHSPHLSNGTP